MARDERTWPAVLSLGLALIATAGIVLSKPDDRREQTPPTIGLERRSAARSEPIRPLPASLDLDVRRVALGERLFHDGRLSRDGSISCASCHDLAAGGVDGRRIAIGIDDRRGSVNTPTVFNSSYNFRQFWDGRAESLEEQVDGPLLHPDEMDGSWPELLAELAADVEYSRAFVRLYGEITAEAVRDALATFESSLITPNAPFDRYLLGDETAISGAAREGYTLFKDLGCVSCHQGINVGGNMFERFGIMADPFGERLIRPADLGRYNVTGREEDRHVFKVPSLRNVALTPPYFHDASAATLQEAVRTMSRVQLGRELADPETVQITAFLETLTGEQPETRR